MGVIRFFKLNPEQSKDFQSVIIPDGDIMPLDVFKNSKEVYRNSEMVIVQVLLNNKTLNELSEIAEVDNPLSTEAVQALDIIGSYCGRDYSDEPGVGLFWFFPDLAGKEVIGQDDEGNDIEKYIVLRHRWSGVEI